MPNVAIILTEEGPLNTFNGYNDSSQALKERGITIMSLGVGNKVNQYELQRIATSPELAFTANTLDDAIASIATVANASCLGKLMTNYRGALINQCRNLRYCIYEKPLLSSMFARTVGIFISIEILTLLQNYFTVQNFKEN